MLTMIPIGVRTEWSVADVNDENDTPLYDTYYIVLQLSAIRKCKPCHYGHGNLFDSSMVR
jgi:hypothetical protein